MGKLKIFVYSFTLLFLTLINEIPACFASAVDAANAGVKASENGDKNKAKVLFRSALKSNELSKKNYMIVNNHLCSILGSESKTREAISCYSETLYLSGENSCALSNRGVLYYRIGDHEKAIKDFSRYILLFPKDDFGYTHRALSSIAIKKFDTAILDLNKSIKLKPNKGEGYIHRGNTYFETGNYHLAVADFEKAIEVDPQNPSVYQAMAWFFSTCPERDFRDGAGALKFAEKSLELEKKDKSNPMFYDTLAAAYASQDNFKKPFKLKNRPLSCSREKKIFQIYQKKKFSIGLICIKAENPTEECKILDSI